MVSHANPPGNRLNQPMVEEVGATVRERQLILRVVDVQGPMRVNAKVREMLVDRVVVGQGAMITVDAFPGQVFEGIVKAVSPRPDPEAIAVPDGSPRGAMQKQLHKVYSTIGRMTKGLASPRHDGGG